MTNSLEAADAAMRSCGAALRWARALPAEEYWIAAIPAEGAARNVIHRRVWDTCELERGLGWLRYLNSRHHHIVGRPVDPRHVLVDDLTPAAVEALARHHPPAAIVASSPGNLQVWVTMESRVAPEVAGAVARILAARYGGDRGAASARQPGRIPGFTNRKARHRRADGLYPYAVLLQADGAHMGPAGQDLVAEAEAMLALGRQPTRPVLPDAPLPSRARGLALRSPAAERAEAVARVAAALPADDVIDRSRLDHAVARRLLGRGMPAAEAVAVVLAGGKASGMAPAAAEAYARRTVEAALVALGRRPGWAPAG
jgi:hypothetical protein